MPVLYEKWVKAHIPRLGWRKYSLATTFVMLSSEISAGCCPQGQCCGWFDPNPSLDSIVCWNHQECTMTFSWSNMPPSAAAAWALLSTLNAVSGNVPRPCRLCMCCSFYLPGKIWQRTKRNVKCYQETFPLVQHDVMESVQALPWLLWLSD